MTPKFSDEQSAQAEQIITLLNISVYAILALCLVEPIGALRAAHDGNDPVSPFNILWPELFKLVPVLPAGMAVLEAKKMCERAMAGIVLDSMNAKSLSLIDKLLAGGLIWSAILVPIVFSRMDQSSSGEVSWTESLSPTVLGYVIVLYAFSRMFKLIVSTLQPPRGT
ncbi:MAG: hypothetical protein AAF996_05665 [Pseudomonadota bacterium]